METKAKSNSSTIEKARRWYDKDPVLSKAMSTLEHSDDQVQIQIALNLIKIVIEHKIENEDVFSLNDIMNTFNQASKQEGQKKLRWYDLNETVRAAIIMLQNCPETMRSKIAVEMADLVKNVIQYQ